jgi:hypothetical protein
MAVSGDSQPRLTMLTAFVAKLGDEDKVAQLNTH